MRERGRERVCVLLVTTRYSKLYHVVAQHVDAVSSLCGPFVIHVYCLPWEGGGGGGLGEEGRGRGGEERKGERRESGETEGERGRAWH